LQGEAGLEGNGYAGSMMEAIEKGRVELAAEVGEGTELRRIVCVVVGQHPAGGSGGFGERGDTVEHRDTNAAMMEFQGKREADDAGPGDTDVGFVHGISLVD
jgi:hypothetical protein